MHVYQRQNLFSETLLTRPSIVRSALMIVIRMELTVYHCHLGLQSLPTLLLCTATTTSLSNQLTYQKKNRWHSVDTEYNILSIQSQSQSIILIIFSQTYSLPTRLIGCDPFGTAEPSDILGHVALFHLKFIHIAKWIILPPICLIIFNFSHATAHYNLVIFL